MGMGGRGLPIGPPGAGFWVMAAVPPPAGGDLVSVLPVPDRWPFLENPSLAAPARAKAATSIGRTPLVMAKHLSTFINCPLAGLPHEAAAEKLLTSLGTRFDGR